MLNTDILYLKKNNNKILNTTWKNIRFDFKKNRKKIFFSLLKLTSNLM